MKKVLFLVLVLPWLSGSSSTNLSLDAVIQKNIEARGGAENWANVQSIVIRGDYEAFAKTAPFTMYRQRPGFYRFDHVILGAPVVNGFDGEKCWFYSPPRIKQARPMPPAFAKAVLREKFFEPPFWNAAQKGHQVSYIGLVDLDGEQAHQLDVKLPSGESESWFLDPETFLTKKLKGITWDYGRRVIIEAYFDDYREVSGVIMPFAIEQEFHTRYRVFTIEEIEINAELDENVFKMEAFQPADSESN